MVTGTLVDEQEEDGVTASTKSVSAFRAVRVFRIFRMLRVLRVTRILRALAFMQVIVNVIGKTMTQFIYIAFLLFIFVYIYSLLGMQIYGAEDPVYFSYGRNDFYSFLDSFISVF